MALLANIIEWKLTLGDALVAIGTIALALFTFWLAWQTRREVGVSTESIKLSRQAIESQDMPFVIPRPRRVNRGNWWIGWEQTSSHWWHTTSHWRLKMCLLNVGRGPAILRDVRLTVGELGTAEAVEVMGEVHMHGQIPLAAEQELHVDLPLNGEPPIDAGTGVMRLYYAHANGNEYMTRCEVDLGKDGVLCRNIERRESDGQHRRPAYLQLS